ncbi:MAG: thioredoxin domain-containing protein [Gammaproteobacteria bacterium]
MTTSPHTGNHEPNALIHETSPYLQQHAHNPVDWYPWNEEALEKARREDKPILLSIGYSACHWCHVMAHESFEDEETAALMNEHYVNIKVDREERPDLDKIYQIGQQLLSQRPGGWPLTLFLTPDDQVPFFGGTYFPREAKFGMPGFKDLLVRIAELYRTEAEAIRNQNQSFMEALQRLEPAPAADSGDIDPGILQQCVDELAENFDAVNGGFTGAPKFPHTTNIEFLLARYCLQRDRDPDRADGCLKMAALSLTKMADGGIYDHLGGGFCRYSTDETWSIPHFEKMLYDNGPLLGAYADAWKITGDELYQRAAKETAEWVMRDMQSPEGGYYSSLDADSEGEEGRFYLWTPEEVQSLLCEEEYRVFALRYGLGRSPNFEGRWHLEAVVSIDDIAKQQSLDTDKVNALLDSARNKLLAARNERVWPGRDEKILTSWNALMIRGMAVAAARLDEPAWADSAERALDFIQERLWRDGRLLATCKDGRAHLNAYLDDYAFLIDAVLRFLNVRWQTRRLDFVLELADTMLSLYHDDKDGGFYFTSIDHESLLQRRKEFMDDSLPAGNGVAADALFRLGCLTGRQEYLDAAEDTLQAAWPSLQRLPHAHVAVLTALQTRYFPHAQIVLRGPEAALRHWQRLVLQYSDALTEVYAVPEEATGLPDLLEERRSAGQPLAYICEGMSCREPVNDLDELKRYLKPTGSQ